MGAEPKLMVGEDGPDCMLEGLVASGGRRDDTTIAGPAGDTCTTQRDEARRSAQNIKASRNHNFDGK